MDRRALIFGSVTGAALLVLAVAAGPGGDFWPGLGFAAAMALLGALGFAVAVRVGGRRGR